MCLKSDKVQRTTWLLTTFRSTPHAALEQSPSSGIAIYTDVSKMECGTGIVDFCSDCSVFQVEIFAIKKGKDLLTNGQTIQQMLN